MVISHREPRSIRAGAQHRPGVRTVPPSRRAAGEPLTVVFVVPCLNEERVLAASLERFSSFTYPRMHVLVVDDGSDDATAQIVRDHGDPRISLLQRTPPEARQGKGEALNAAIRHLQRGAVLPIRSSQDVIVCVMDADGPLEDHTQETVLPQFENQQLGAVQIGVRINNRRENLLARMQDIEFVLYTDVFQRGRRHLGSVGLGGNGQFVRLSALETLEGPWSRSLAEDLDLGLRLQSWSIDFCSETTVHQQGLVDARRWVRQRTRWFQGHLQTWPMTWSVLRGFSGRQCVDLVYHMTSPALLLGTVYWRREWSSVGGLVAAAAYLHLYVLYATLWYIAGWRAVFRVLTGHTAWSKTERTGDDQEGTAMAPVPAGSGA